MSTCGAAGKAWGLAMVALGAWLASPLVALADAVGPCPPGFEADHSGCHFQPGVGEILVCACCLGGIAVGAGLVVVLVMRGRNKKGAREG